MNYAVIISTHNHQELFSRASKFGFIHDGDTVMMVADCGDGTLLTVEDVILDLKENWGDVTVFLEESCPARSACLLIARLTAIGVHRAQARNQEAWSWAAYIVYEGEAIRALNMEISVNTPSGS